MRSRRAAALAFAVLLVSLLCQLSLAAKAPDLPAQDRHWLQEEVNYLITDDERAAFLHLGTEDDRQKFIEHFWALRNPDPAAPTNAAREEHYQRLAYANAHFGDPGVHDGWRTDRGMVYITLGPPQLVSRHPETPELRPIEIWFYQNLGGALPTHFYVLFYRKSAAEDYELYSPYGDRPQKLINSTNAINNDGLAEKLIQRDIDDEAAHVALSLIPGEPVDLKNPSPSLQSDVLLNNIRNYRNLPQVREMLAARASNENVTHRILLGNQVSDLCAIATRDAGYRASIHYFFRLLQPEDLSFTEQAADRYYYALELEVKLLSDAHQAVFSRTEKLSDYLKSGEAERLRSERFGVEGRIPASPGRYTLSVTLTDLRTRQAFHQERPVTVPGTEDRVGLSQIFFANALAPVRRGDASAPFGFSGVRLEPIGANNSSVSQGEPLRAVFQVWAPPAAPAQLRGKVLHVHYLIGSVNAQARQEEDQELDRGSFTADGNLLVGKDLRTESLAPGFYRFVVKVSDPLSGATAYQSLNFEVRAPGRPGLDTWIVDAAQP